MQKFLKIKNKCDMDLSKTEDLFHSLGKFAKDRMGFKKPPVLNLVSDQDNSIKPLGKTAYYDPQSMSVTIYVDNRHTKDILRSLAHELVHHTQNENGMLNDSGYHGAGYAQKNKDLRQSEKEAYLKGNMCFRDWEDSLKQSKPTIYNEWRINTMSTKDWKNKELMENISNKFGFKMNLKALNESKNKEYDLEENQDRIFAPNHYCLHHVVYEGKEGHTIDHNWNEKLQKVTKYDVKFKDGTIIRNIHESKLTIVEAFTEGEHKKEDHPPVKKALDEEEKEELEEGEIPDGLKKHQEKEAEKKKAKETGGEKEEKDSDGSSKVAKAKEGEKPDFLDINKDGDKSQSLKAAAADAKAKGIKESRIMKIIKDEIRRQLKERK